MNARSDVYFSADVETDGPIPGPYSLLSLGVCVAGEYDGRTFTQADPAAQTYYAEFRPVGERIDEQALAVSGLDRDELLRTGTDPRDAMTDLARWVREQAAGRRPVLAAYPAAFDWLWLYWYFVRYAEGGSPFGFSGCLDLKTFYAARAGATIGASTKRQMPRHLLSHRPHTHHALDDAIEQADLFVNLMRWQPARPPPHPPT